MPLNYSLGIQIYGFLEEKQEMGHKQLHPQTDFARFRGAEQVLEQ